MGLPMPKLYVLPEDSPNAFATGRNPSHASLAFTSGILRRMNDNELEGVAAHELGHVLHRDILISSVAATLAAAITFLARMAFWFTPSSRDDEDSGGGAIAAIAMMILAPCRHAHPDGHLALSRIRRRCRLRQIRRLALPADQRLEGADNWSKRIPMDASPSTAHMFIIKPFSGGSMMRLFSTHPSTEDRIARLQAMR